MVTSHVQCILGILHKMYEKCLDRIEISVYQSICFEQLILVRAVGNVTLKMFLMYCMDILRTNM